MSCNITRLLRWVVASATVFYVIVNIAVLQQHSAIIIPRNLSENGQQQQEALQLSSSLKAQPLQPQQSLFNHHQQQQLPFTTPSKDNHINNNKNRRLQGQSKTATIDKHDKSKLHIPFWEQQTLFRSRSSWQVTVIIMAHDCFQVAYTTTSQENNFQFPSLPTLQDALHTNQPNIQVMVYLPQLPQSTMFPSTERQDQFQQCQAELVTRIKLKYPMELSQNKLRLQFGVVNPLPPRIKYDYHHQILPRLEPLKKVMPAVGNDATQWQQAEQQLRQNQQQEQLQLEMDYSLGLDFAYLAELIYTTPGSDLVLWLQPGTRLVPELRNGQFDYDYGRKLIHHYENYQLRGHQDLLVRRFCYMSFLQNDIWEQEPSTGVPFHDPTGKQPPPKQEIVTPPRYQSSLKLPTGILMERHGLYRMSMVLRSLLPYHKNSAAQLMLQYCTELLWESQIVQPVKGATQFQNISQDLDMADTPPAMFVDELSPKQQKQNVPSTEEEETVDPQLIQTELAQLQQQLNDNQADVPPWVTVHPNQLGPQRDSGANELLLQPLAAESTPLPKNNKTLVTFVVPTSTRPNGIKNQYVTYSLNQLFPLIRRDFHDNGQFQATVLLVICGNTQEELDDHQAGLWDYYGPEIKEGILEIVATNLVTYPSLTNLPNNYGDEEPRLRWRSKQNLDISSSFFAAKGKSKYVMLLEDDTGYRDGFTTTLKLMLEADQRQEQAIAPQPAVTQVSVPNNYADDYRQHLFAQVHFGFGYSGVLIHDDDALVYAVLHYVLMDEKPCDLLWLANYLQGQVLDQKFRWQIKKVLITHLGSVSSLKGKFQPVWGIKG